jgi:hypothetical protein
MSHQYVSSGKFPDAHGSGPTKFDDKARERYINFIRTHGNRPMLAARASGVHYTTTRVYLKNDPEFALLVEEALEEHAMLLEQEARRRAVEGVTEPIINREGEIVGEKQVYSDRLMLELLKANDPAKFREIKQLEVNHKGGVLLVSDQAPALDLEGDLQRLSDRQTEMMEEGGLETDS